MKDSDSAFSTVPVQLTATFRIVGLLRCETKRMVRSSLEHKAKGLRSSRSEINPLLFGDAGGFSIIDLESIDPISATDTLSLGRAGRAWGALLVAEAFSVLWDLISQRYRRPNVTPDSQMTHVGFKISLARTWTSAGL